MKEYLGFNMASSGEWDCVNKACAPESASTLSSTLTSLSDAYKSIYPDEALSGLLPAAPSVGITPDGREDFRYGSVAYVDAWGAKVYISPQVEQVAGHDVARAIVKVRRAPGALFRVIASPAQSVLIVQAANHTGADYWDGTNWTDFDTSPYTP